MSESNQTYLSQHMVVISRACITTDCYCGDVGGPTVDGSVKFGGSLFSRQKGIQLSLESPRKYTAGAEEGSRLTRVAGSKVSIE